MYSGVEMGLGIPTYLIRVHIIGLYLANIVEGTEISARVQVGLYTGRIRTILRRRPDAGDYTNEIDGPRFVG